MNHSTWRKGLIYWCYAMTILHLVAGIVLAWCASLPMFSAYHQAVLQAFGSATSPAALALHTWWLSLFGATLQNLAIFMGLLIYLGARYRNPNIWLWILLGLAIWAPQDMLISLRANLWLHVYGDLLALAVLLPPLFALWRIDAKHLPTPCEPR